MSPIDTKSSRTDATIDWAARVDELFQALRQKHGVVDVKFSFGPMKDKQPAEIYRAVAAALSAVLEDKAKEFPGLKDSYGLKRR